VPKPPNQLGSCHQIRKAFVSAHRRPGTGGSACWYGAKIASCGVRRLIGSAVRKLVALLVLALTASGSAGAQTYPVRPITIVVPFAAGGPTDALVRILSERMRVSGSPWWSNT
jgi:hypothetical protein